MAEAEAGDIEALRAQLAAAEAELKKHREEKEAMQADLESAQKEKAEADEKMNYLNKIGITEEEFAERRVGVEKKLGIKLDELKGRKVTLEHALEQCPSLSKQVISGSMLMQKDIQEQLGNLKALIDERQKVLLDQVKQLEEDKLNAIQHQASALRSERGKLSDRIAAADSVLNDTIVTDYFERCDAEEKLLDDMMCSSTDMSITTDVEYEKCQLDLAELTQLLSNRLDFDPSEEGVGEEKASEEEGLAAQVEELKQKLKALNAEKQQCVEAEDFLEAARKKTEIEEASAELEELLAQLPSYEDAQEAKKRAKYEKEIADGLRNWESVRYQKTVREGKQQSGGFMNFLF